MLTTIQLMSLLFLTSISLADAERLFHSRDHSDVQIPASHRAELIADKYAAEVTIVFIYNFKCFCKEHICILPEVPNHVPRMTKWLHW